MRIKTIEHLRAPVSGALLELDAIEVSDDVLRIRSEIHRRASAADAIAIAVPGSTGRSAVRL